MQHPAFRGQTYAEAVMATKPVRYYRCGEAAGQTTMVDLAGTANATVTGTPTKMAATGPPGIPDGRGFQTTNASGGYALAGTGAWPSTAYSIAAWSFVTAQIASASGIFGKWDGSGVGAMLYKPNNTNITFLHRSTLLNSGAIPLSSWQFLVGTWDGANLRFYVNGIQKAGPTAMTTAPGDLQQWAISTYYASGSPENRINTGSVSECAVWDRALSIGEVAHLNAIGWGE